MTDREYIQQLIMDLDRVLTYEGALLRRTAAVREAWRLHDALVWLYTNSPD